MERYATAAAWASHGGWAFATAVTLGDKKAGWIIFVYWISLVTPALPWLLGTDGATTLTTRCRSLTKPVVAETGGSDYETDAHKKHDDK